MKRNQTAYRTLINHMVQIVKQSVLTDMSDSSIPVITFINSDSCKPKQFISEILGSTHWTLNYKGKHAPYLYKGNYDEYMSPDGKVLTPWEVLVYNCARVWQDTMQATRSSLAMAQNHEETPEVWNTLRRGCERVVTDIKSFRAHKN